MLESSGLNCCSVCLAVLCHGVSVRFCRPRCWVYPFCPNHFARLSSCLAGSSQTIMDTFGNHFAPYVYLCKLELVTPFHHEPSGNLDVGAPIVFAPGGQDKCRVCEQNLCHLSLGPKRVGRKSQYSNLFSTEAFLAECSSRHVRLHCCVCSRFIQDKVDQ